MNGDEEENNFPVKIKRALPWLARYPFVRAKSFWEAEPNLKKISSSSSSIISSRPGKRAADITVSTSSAAISSIGTRNGRSRQGHRRNAISPHEFFSRRTIRPQNFRTARDDAARRFGRSGNPSASRHQGAGHAGKSAENLNQIYECSLPLNKRVPHRKGISVCVFGNQPRLPLIFTGPLIFNWTNRFAGVVPVPRIDDGALSASQLLGRCSLAALARGEHYGQRASRMDFC